MALELYDIMARYNKAKEIDDDMMKDIELQKIQADFKVNNDTLELQERRIAELEEDVGNLRLANERLKDYNAQLRLEVGSPVETKEEKVEEVKEEVEEVKRTLIEIAEDF